MRCALIVGGAESWCDDWDRLHDMIGQAWPGPILACNDVGCFLPDLDHWASLHGAKFRGKAAWEERRASDGNGRLAVIPDNRRARLEKWMLDWDATGPLPRQYETWSHEKRSELDHHYPEYTGGSSGFFAAMIALQKLGIERGVLVGIRMDGQGNAFRREGSWKPERYLRGWQREMATVKDRLRSMSGATREWFGYPDRDFLAYDAVFT